MEKQPATRPARLTLLREATVSWQVGEHSIEALHPICYPSTMAMNIKDPQTEALAAEVAALANETKTQAVRTALQERKERLQARTRRHARAQRIDRFLEDEAWPQIPEAVLGRPISKTEREMVLGYGSEGV
jgi:antitoxin VapB